MNQFAKRSLVCAETIGGVKTSGTGPAYPAPAVFIKRKAVLKSCLTTYAIKLGHQWRRFSETARAHGNASKLGQFRFTDAALVWEKKRKEAIRNLAEDGGEGDRES